ncbi:RloA protein [Neisseria wadsworthii 9715]|uniref:RloA protein n=2 Tax=Neisseria TaxID=482 RepID=G4CND8_9NEIS|nr:RloA protein [Neisseria wadsworthii 9715]
MGIEMLIEFSVTNFRSFCNSQTLSLVKSKGNELPDNAFEVEGIKDLDLLHSAAIYGANASGKSNLLKSIRAMKQIVTATSQRGSKLPITPFKLNKDSISKPTEFEVVFIVDNVRYQYGFSATEEKIFEEWLFAYPKGRAQKWFERIWSSEKNQYQWQFGNFLTGTKQVWQNATRENALFLSTAVQLNSEQLKPLFDWFKETLRFSSVGGFGPEYSASLCMENRKEEILKFMHAADLNISDINIETEDFSPSVLPNDMPESLREIIIDGMKDKKMMNIQTIHLDSQGNSIRFDLEEESDGTQKFFAFAGPWLDVLTNGYVLFVDELHDNLHPKLVQFLVGLFHSKKTNPKNAQLIFTTHETSILNQDVFRRDQVWFCERNQEQETVVYPLSDFSPKKGKENLEAAYLSGRYGALPFLRSLDTL